MELMIPLSEVEQPAVLLASGPGPAPAAADRTAQPPTAMLYQLDRESGLRGWILRVCTDDAASTWPRHHFSRAAAGHPPMLEARAEALAALGYEVTGDGWQWREYVAMNGKRVELSAYTDVRPLAGRADAHDAAIGHKGAGKTTAADLSAHAMRIAAAGS